MGLCGGVAVILAYCASQAPPPGGPVDETAPFVVETFPPADTTNISRDIDVKIVFSEPVKPSTCESSLFITPFPGENVKYRWKRDRKLTIEFSDSLLDDRTYVITIGAGTRDRRNNMMKESYTLAFSTGPQLDRGEINGHVFGNGEISGTQMWAYDLDVHSSPNPARESPIYITQCGETGAFSFTHMAFGLYRLFAVQDRDMNTLYNAEFDQLGVAFSDVRLDSLQRQKSGMTFRIARRDTTPPVLVDVVAPDQRHVNVRFSEPMDTTALENPDNFTIVSETGDSLPVLDAALDFRNLALVHLATVAQTAEMSYNLCVQRAMDANFLSIPADSGLATFTGSGVPDTTRPRYLAMQPHDSSTLVPLQSKFRIYFTKAMNQETVNRHFMVADTLGNTIPGTVAWPNLTKCLFTPSEAFKPETYYEIALPVDSVFDIAGNALADTLFKKYFITMDPDTLSEIGGTVIDPDTNATGPIFLKAELLDDKESREKKLWLESAGTYRFRDLLPGEYRIRGYRDRDENGRYSWGEAFLFQPAERYFVYPDTIKIRAQWPNEGNNIILPSGSE